MSKFLDDDDNHNARAKAIPWVSPKTAELIKCHRLSIKRFHSGYKQKQDVFVKNECPCTSNFFENVTLIFDLDR